METLTCILALLLARPVWSMPIEPQLEEKDIGSLSLLTETISAMLATMARLSKQSQVVEDGHILKPSQYRNIEDIILENSNYETQESFLASRINSEELNEAPSENENNEASQSENENQDEPNINSSDTDSSLMVSSDAENSLKDASQQSTDEALNEEVQEQSLEIAVPLGIQEIIADDPSKVPESPEVTDPEASENKDSESPPEEKRLNKLKLILSEIECLTKSNTGGCAEIAHLQELLNQLSKDSFSSNIEGNIEIEDSMNVADQESTNLEPAGHNSELQDSQKTLTDIPEDNINSDAEELLGTPDSDGINMVQNNEVPEILENETPSEAIETDPESVELNPTSVNDASENKEVDTSQLVENDASVISDDLSSIVLDVESNVAELLNLPAETNDAPLHVSETKETEDLSNLPAEENDAPLEVAETKETEDLSNLPAEANDAPLDVSETKETEELSNLPAEANDAPLEVVETKETEDLSNLPAEANDAPLDVSETIETEELSNLPAEANDAPLEVAETKETEDLSNLPAEANDAPLEVVETKETEELSNLPAEENDAPLEVSETKETEEISNLPAEANDAPLDVSETKETEDLSNLPAEANNAPLEVSETKETDLETGNQELSEIKENNFDKSKMDKYLNLLKNNANTLKRNILSSSNQRLKAENTLIDLFSMIVYGASFLA